MTPQPLAIPIMPLAAKHSGTLARHAQRTRRPAPLSALPLLLSALLLCTGAALSQAQEGQVMGRILAAQVGEGGLEGTKVVLMEFVLDEGGQPRGRPLQSVEADAEGSYLFEGVPISRKAVYKLGTRVNGVLVGSEAFTFPEGAVEVLLNLQVPGLTDDSSSLRFREGVLALEPTRGGVWVTQVLHLENPGTDTVEGLRDPLAVGLPSGVEQLEVLRGVEEDAESRQLGQQLLFYGNLPPGVTILAFRYRLSTPLGSLRMAPRFDHPMEDFTVLAPEASLKLKGTLLERREARELNNGGRYESWGVSNLPADTQVTLSASGIPMRQELLLLSLLGFFAAVAGLLGWFLWRRLPNESQRPGEAPALGDDGTEPAAEDDGNGQEGR